MKLSQLITEQIKASTLGHFKSLNTESTVNLQLYNEVISSGERLKALEREVVIPRDTAFVLADLAPQYNWAHPCMYLLYDAQTAELYEKVKASFPPQQLRRKPENVVLFHGPVRMIDTTIKAFPQTIKSQRKLDVLATHPGKRFAILFSGDSDNRHVNDMEFLYRTLVDVYGFSPTDIYVLNHDGTINYDGGPKPVGKWPGDNTPYRMKVKGKGTRAAFQSTLNSLADKIRSSDLLFLHTNNHGAGPGDGVSDFCLCAYHADDDWAGYFVDDFVSDLNVLPEFDVLMVMMEQCRSGGFIDPIRNNSPATRTHIATAVKASDPSIGGANFDPFAEDWIAGIAGQYPDGGALADLVDKTGDGRISAVEAFAYADSVHDAADTPTASDSPNGCGKSIFFNLPAQALHLSEGACTIRQKSSNRFMDAHETKGKDFSVVTRTAQDNDTQKWILSPLGGLYTIQQQSSSRFLDAHETSGKDFSVVTRNAQGNDTQRWVLLSYDRELCTYTIQQLSNGRFLDAHESAGKDYSVVTRNRQNNDTQRWRLTPLSNGRFTVRQLSSGRFLDAHEAEGKDFSVCTRQEQGNDSQEWILRPVAGVYSIQQKSSLRCLDAHEDSGNDFSSVTRGAQNNDTQRWVLTYLGGDTYTMQQLSNGRFLDAHESDGKDFSVVTREKQKNDSQRWVIEPS